MPAHPNELDLRRIQRALKSRRRYRYVEPRVVKAAGGYRIESACCSRNIDKEGGVVDIALLLFDPARTLWQLFRKDHAAQAWVLESTDARLPEALDLITVDGERKFWQ